MINFGAKTIMNNILAVIPARGGSVRLPNKNIRDLGGKPLIYWTINAALESDCNRVLVSTDSEKIALISKDIGADVPFRRPENISGNIPSELVIKHAVNFHENEIGKIIDLVVTIQPTTPFLSSKDINKGIEMIKNNKFLDSAFTAGPVHQRPEWMFKIDPKTNIATNIFSNTIKGELGVSQTLPRLWHPNGGAYFTKRNTLLEKNCLIGHNPGIIEMDLMNSVDIDEEVDFMNAESVFKFKNKNIEK